VSLQSFHLRMSNRSGEIECREQGKMLRIDCEMSRVSRYDLLLAPLSLASWSSPSEPIDAAKQREILSALRQWLGSQRLRTDIDLPAQASASEAKCHWSGCKQPQLGGSAYCEEHYDATLLSNQ
jgi:hypothetical protein